MNRYVEIISDTFHFLTAKVSIKNDVRPRKVLDPERIQEIEKILYFLIFVVLSSIMPFIFGAPIFFYWVLLSFVAYILLRYDFFEGRPRNSVKFEYKAKNADRTFLEKGGQSEANGKSAKTTQQKTAKKIKKKENEFYELKQEPKSLKKLQTQYFKDFSPHSNRLQSLNKKEISTFPIVNDYYQNEDQSELLVKETKLMDRFRLLPQEKLLSKISEVHNESRGSDDHESPIQSPKIKVTEIKNEYDLAYKLHKEIAALYGSSLQKAETEKGEPSFKPSSPIKLSDNSPSSPDSPLRAREDKSPNPEKQQAAPTVTSSISRPLFTVGGPKPVTEVQPKTEAGPTSLFNLSKSTPQSEQPKPTTPSQPLFNIQPQEPKPEITTKPVNPEPKPSGSLFPLGSSSVFSSNSQTVSPSPGLGGLFNKSPQQTTNTTQSTIVQSTSGVPSQAVTGGEASDKAYTEFFTVNGKIVDHITGLLQNELTRAGVEKVERLPGLRPVIDEVRPMLNAKFTNQIGSVLRSADIIITKFTENINNKVNYYGLIHYITDNVIKNIESYYEKGQKLSLYFRLALILLINKKVPGLAEYMMLKMAKDVPILGGVEPKRQPGMSEADFLRLQGYKVSGTERESYKEYDKRLNAYTYFLFMMMTLMLEDVLQDAPPEEKGPNIMQVAAGAFKARTSYDWMYWSFIKFFLKVPVQLSTVHVLVGFYYSSAYALRRQPRHVIRLMKLLYVKYIPELEKFGATIRDTEEKNDFIENKLRFLKNKLKKFHDNDQEGMNILTPVEEAKREEIRVEDDRE